MAATAEHVRGGATGGGVPEGLEGERMRESPVADSVGPSADNGAPIGLTQLETAVLDFEERHPRHTPAKADAIRRRLGLSATRYYQILGTLIETPEALADRPMLIGRLRRIRDGRADERSRRREQRRSSAATATIAHRPAAEPGPRQIR